MEYYEIPHFFTQWGAKAAPKFVGKVKGRRKKLFGWDTDSMSEEYRNFLGQFIPAVIGCFRSQGVDRNCFWHISDEPKKDSLGQYIRCKNILAPLIGDYHVIDALSDYEFYENGALTKPVPAIKHIKPFLDHHVPGLWAYYYGANGTVDNSTNRFLSLPLSRIRILGVQLYLYQIEGFLHWGYNYYHSWQSYDTVNPYADTTGDWFAPAGDMFLVYPGKDGKPQRTLRLNAMREAMEDIRALELCESVIGREATVKLVREVGGMEITFTDYPSGGEFFLTLRRRIILAIRGEDQ